MINIIAAEIAANIKGDYELVRDTNQEAAGFNEIGAKITAPNGDTASLVITEDGEDVLYSINDYQGGCPAKDAVEELTKALS